MQVSNHQKISTEASGGTRPNMNKAEGATKTPGSIMMCRPFYVGFARRYFVALPVVEAWKYMTLHLNLQKALSCFSFFSKGDILSNILSLVLFR